MPKTDEIDPKTLEGRKFRFLVGSAEEAARIIRERLGKTARVLSVKQVQGKGLSRFLSSPQLEVIVEVPIFEDNTATPEKSSQQKQTAQQPRKDVAREENSGKEKTSAQTNFQEHIGNTTEEFSGKQETGYDDMPKSDPLVYSRRPYTKSSGNTIDSILVKSGFSKEVLSKLKLSPNFPVLEQESLVAGLAEVSHWLQSSFKSVPQNPVTGKIVFLGASGTGKTTALCKYLANQVFIRQKRAQVLKIDNETPNSDDALRVFCDFLSVPFYRDPIESDRISAEDLLIVDSPGAPYNDEKEWLAVRERLDDLGIDTRVLVINASYDTDLIKDGYQLGKQMGITHVVFTHLDELRNYSKLWEFILNGHISPLFLTYGQNITSEYTESVLDFLINKTFPSIINT